MTFSLITKNLFIFFLFFLCLFFSSKTFSSEQKNLRRNAYIRNIKIYPYQKNFFDSIPCEKTELIIPISQEEGYSVILLDNHVRISLKNFSHNSFNKENSLSSSISSDLFQKIENLFNHQKKERELESNLYKNEELRSNLIRHKMN